LFGFGIDTWLIVVAAVLVRLSTAKNITVFSAIVTIVVGVVAGITLHVPVVALLSLSASWHIPVAILITLTSENLMRSLVEITYDTSFLKNILGTFLEGKIKK
jgi:hypothetical protein